MNIPGFVRFGCMLGAHGRKSISQVRQRLSLTCPMLNLVWLLSDPAPFLNLTLNTGRRTRSLSLEPALVRATSRLNSPWLFALLTVGYIVGLAFFSRAQSFFTPPDSYIDCTSAYWAANAGCGLNGEDCGPYTNATFEFRCPAQCSSVILQNPRTVGNEQVDFVPLIVGGGDPDRTYRGDTFICAAAVQAYVSLLNRGIV